MEQRARLTLITTNSKRHVRNLSDQEINKLVGRHLFRMPEPDQWFSSEQIISFFDKKDERTKQRFVIALQILSGCTGRHSRLVESYRLIFNLNAKTVAIASLQVLGIIDEHGFLK